MNRQLLPRHCPSKEAHPEALPIVSIVVPLFGYITSVMVRIL